MLELLEMLRNVQDNGLLFIRISVFFVFNLRKKNQKTKKPKLKGKQRLEKKKSEC